MVKDYSDFYGDGYTVVEGKISDFNRKLTGIEFVVEGYIDQQKLLVPVDEDGTFAAVFPVEDVQDVFFAFDRSIFRFFTYPGDTIRVEFQQKDPVGTLKLSGTSSERTKELELCLLLSRHRNQAKLMEEIHRTDLPDSVRLGLLNCYYQERIAIIDGYEAANGPLTFAYKLRADVYFDVCHTVLVSRSKPLLAGINNGSFNALINYNSIDYHVFKTSPAFRNYLSRYIFMNSIPPYRWSSFNFGESEKLANLQRSYYYALSLELQPPIRDWYITERALLGISESSPEEIESFLNDFKAICRNEKYMDRLDAMYADIAGLYDGSPAPDFMLKDENGKEVSLSDFRGKIVYLDFWNSYCGPCIDQFLNYDKKFHEKYADHDIVHIYICFTEDETRWKKEIVQYDLQGINLITDSRPDNPIRKNYVATAYPHYVLIGRDGKIVRNDCERPSEMLGNGNHSLFRLLKLE